jgi:hypothetical protein
MQSASRKEGSKESEKEAATPLLLYLMLHILHALLLIVVHVYRYNSMIPRTPPCPADTLLIKTKMMLLFDP